LCKVIGVALNALLIGQPTFAASAKLLNVTSSIPATLPTNVKVIPVIAKPPFTASKVTLASTVSCPGVQPAWLIAKLHAMA
jgi:hypothetical protein